VLAALRHAKRFSVWDMDSRDLRATVGDLQRSGRITTNNNTPFPWVNVIVNEPSPPPFVQSIGTEEPKNA
jgi:hypothetical protein